MDTLRIRLRTLAGQTETHTVASEHDMCKLLDRLVTMSKDVAPWSPSRVTGYTLVGYQRLFPAQSVKRS